MHNVVPSIFSHGPVVIFQWTNTPRWAVHYVTPNVQAVFGYSMEEFLRHDIHYDALVHPDDKSRVSEEIEHHSQSGCSHFQHEQYRTLDKNGRIIWVESHVHIVRDPDGQIAHYLGYVIDITTQKSVEQERLAMLNAIPDLMFTINHDGEFLDYHVRNPDDLAMPPEAFLGKKLLEVFPPHLGQAGMKCLQQALAYGGVSIHEYTITTMAGDCRDFEARYIAKGNGEALAIIRDISQVNRAKSNLRDREAQLNLIADQIQAVFWTLDTNLKFTMAKGAGLKKLGLSPEQLLRTTLGDHFETDDAGFSPQLYLTQALSGESVEFELTWNSIIYQSFVEPLHDDKGSIIGVVGISLDITDRKLSEQALRQAKDEAVVASKAKSQFMSRMSHELRTPLNAILGYTELLLDTDAEDPLSENQRSSLNTVHQAGRHLLYLINEVLDLAKIEAGTMQVAQSEVNWLDEVAQCIELTAPLAEKHGVHLHMDFDQNVPELVHADSMRLKQVLLNLLSNAVKYNRRNGCVTVRAKQSDQSTVRIEVHDTGAGLNEQQIENLFQPFNRLTAEDSETEGVGIGLVISKHLIELMGGTIGVSSTPGSDTVFWVELATVNSELKTPEV